ERELGRAGRSAGSKHSPDAASRDLRAALVSALATTACVGSDSRGEPEAASAAAPALAAASEPGDELRAAPSHAPGAVAGTPSSGEGADRLSLPRRFAIVAA